MIDLKVCNIHELVMNEDNPEEVRFEWLGVPFCEDRMRILLDDLGAEDPSDLGILEAETDLHIDIDGDEDIMQLNIMVNYLEEELWEVWDDIDNINDLLDAGVISKYDILNCDISAYTEMPLPIITVGSLEDLGKVYAKSVGLYDNLKESIEFFDFASYAERLLNDGILVKGRTSSWYNGIETKILTSYYTVK